MIVVWLKRDLRLDDHAPLAHAAAACALDGTPMIALAAFEPEVWQAPDADASHLGFYLESLAELDEAIRARGGEGCVPEARKPQAAVNGVERAHDRARSAAKREQAAYDVASCAVWHHLW